VEAKHTEEAPTVFRRRSSCLSPPWIFSADFFYPTFAYRLLHKQNATWLPEFLLKHFYQYINTANRNYRLHWLVCTVI